MFQEYYVNTLKNNYANFEGRARRSEYWYYVLFYGILYIALYAIAIAGLAMDIPVLGMIGGGLAMIFGLANLIPNLAVGVRRLHDTGKSGWMLLVGFIPLIGAILLIVWLASDSTPGSNQYGPNPKEIGGGANADHLLES